MSRLDRDVAPAIDEPWTLGDLRLHWADLLVPHWEPDAGSMLNDLLSPRRVANGALWLRAKAGLIDELRPAINSLLDKLPAEIDGVVLDRIELEADTRSVAADADREGEEWRHR
jgi:hypothetical protein